MNYSGCQVFQHSSLKDSFFGDIMKVQVLLEIIFFDTASISLDDDFVGNFCFGLFLIDPIETEVWYKQIFES